MSHKKELIKNFLSFGAVDILGLLIPIVTMPILTRALGPSQYGVYMLLLTILYFGHTIIDYGTQYTSVRILANQRNNPEEVSLIYQETQGLRLFLCLLYTIGAISYSLFLSFDNAVLYTVLAASTYLFGYALTPLWFYQGIGAVDRAMKVSLAIKVLNLLVIVFAVSSPDDFDIVMASLCIPMLCGGIYLSYLASIKYHVAPPTFSRLGKSFNEGRDVFIGLLAPNFYNAIPTIALGSIYPPAEFAKFAIATRLASVIVTLQNVMAKAIYPVLAMLKDSQVNKLLLLNLIISIIPAIFIYIGGEWALGIFLGKDFSGVNTYLLILCVGIVFIGLSNAISQGYLLPNGHDRTYRNISLRVSFIAGIISFGFIYFYGLLGGAIAITIARAIFFLDYTAVYIKIIRRN
ncbi:TPA: oligosaccharide flippase family protein [Aeromonas dhakensis]|uniref:lipopolysaccharide biosynthesis protein n=1 Tax=Aeromonas dhakensis TaxID=196024 RepID=UPI000E3D5741|nr:oligosaccharide flippase family protein [Aeromonas dhakensis]RFS28747.1 flippase [Aeromonas dhakensis]HDX8438303.1 oligosaccharide flippase family protein [Aeromonas dhakensis]